MTVRQIHTFTSRTDAFREEEVLQENVILVAERGGRPEHVVLTSTAGRNFHRADRHVLPYKRVIEDSTGDHLVRVATNRIEERIVQAVDGLPRRFRELPFRVSTGPVVAFRSREFLRRERSGDTAPLLWPHNVRPFVTQFRPKNGKAEHILVSDESNRLLLPAKRYVLLKRFTAKEERRRLVAGIVEGTDSYAPFLGLENHLNYVYRPTGELSGSEALGLAAFFNSVVVDRYFRAISGNTQVNAAEIRAMPVPDLDTIQKIGRALERADENVLQMAERMVIEAVGLPADLTAGVSEAFK
jgi:adenine-specific DNA-methyltransferase